MNRRAQPWLGTLVDISIADQIGDEHLMQAFQAAFSAIALVQRLMSFYDAYSDVSLFNRALPGAAIEVDWHTYAVLEIADAIKQASNGVFDIACAPLLVANQHLPVIDPSIPHFAPANTLFKLQDDGCVRKLTAGWIDLGGIAKGYAVDLAVEALQAKGINHACVNAGGDLRVIGDMPFPVWIRDPVAPQTMREQIFVQNEALATSAPYFSSKNHSSALFNAAQKRPIIATSSVTVCAPRCVMADALTKVVLGSGDRYHFALENFGARAFYAK
jgi:thiamine biosynthesis lipoprotein